LPPDILLYIKLISYSNLLQSKWNFPGIEVKQNFSQKLRRQKCFIIWVLFLRPHM